MAIDVLAEKQKQYQQSQSQVKSLSDRLNELDKYRTQVNPEMLGDLTNFENRPTGYNPLQDIGQAIQIIERSSAARNAARGDLTAQQNFGNTLLNDIASLQKPNDGFDMLKEIAEANKLGYKYPNQDEILAGLGFEKSEDDYSNLKFTGANKTKVADTLSIASALKNVQNAYSDKYSGLGQRTTGDIGSFLGLSSDEYEKYKTSLATLKNTILYLRSGSQITPEEAKRLMEEIPDWNDSDQKAQAKLSGLQKYLTDKMQGLLLSEGYDVDANDYLTKQIGGFNQGVAGVNEEKGNADINFIEEALKDY